MPRGTPALPSFVPPGIRIAGRGRTRLTPTGSMRSNLTAIGPRLLNDRATLLTRDARVRPPSFKGLREDKQPAQVHRERPGAPQ